MTSRWHFPDKQLPSDTHEVLVALPYLTEVVSGQYVAETGQWFRANSNEEIAPTLWREMPAHPFGGSS